MNRGLSHGIRSAENLGKWKMKASNEAKRDTSFETLGLSMVGAVIACPLRVETPRQKRGLTLDMCVFALYRCFARFCIRRV